MFPNVHFQSWDHQRTLGTPLGSLTGISNLIEPFTANQTQQPNPRPPPLQEFLFFHLMILSPHQTYLSSLYSLPIAPISNSSTIPDNSTHHKFIQIHQFLILFTLFILVPITMIFCLCSFLFLCLLLRVNFSIVKPKLSL